MLVTILHPYQACYEGDSHLADEGYQNGRVASTTKRKSKFHLDWLGYIEPLRISAHLEKAITSFTGGKVQAISGFAARVRTGAFGQGH